MSEKTCSTCRESKPESEFNKHKTNRGGLQAKCRKCQHDYLAQWKRDNKERVNAQTVKDAKKRFEKDPADFRERRNKYQRDRYWKNKSQI
uniref:HNH endonuclease n=1 Tax=Streptomyces sp. NBC_00093 TaxID=2975649 RepID=A0AAU2A9W8_9ACTN